MRCFSWANNCAATEDTNGVDLKSAAFREASARQPRGVIIDKSTSNAVGLPTQFQPTLPPTDGSTGVIKSYILPGNKTGVVSTTSILLMKLCLSSPLFQDVCRILRA